LSLLPRERVLLALAGQEPDAVPWIEGIVEDDIASKIAGEPIRVSWDIAPTGRPVMSGAQLAEEQKKVCRAFGKDNLMYNAFAPIYAERMVGPDGRVMVGRGLIDSRDKLPQLVFPDPHDDSYYAPAAEFLAHKGDYAACGSIRLGIGATLYTMGVEAFTYSLMDGDGLAEEILQRYVDWNVVVVQRLQEMGFDYVWAFDDIAADSGPLISPRLYREVVLPRLKEAVQVIDVPWIYHSDGDLNPLLADLVSLGMNALHPLQPDVMDIYAVREAFPGLGLVGNIDMTLMAQGRPEQVTELVRERIQRLAPAGGYMISSSNSITDYLQEANVRAMVEAVRTYRHRPYTG
jgi:uroporphyrinogen decarboxylase